MLENYKNKFHCSGLHCSFMIFHCLSRLGNLARPHQTIASPRTPPPQTMTMLRMMMITLNYGEGDDYNMRDDIDEGDDDDDDDDCILRITQHSLGGELVGII